MSADLFAEFGSSSNTAAPVQQQQKHTGASPFSFFDDITETPPAQAAPHAIAPSNQDAQQDADDDDWGEFEGDTSSFVKPPLVKQDSFAFVAAAAARARAPTLSTTQEHVGHP
jgi:hypothetical protein